MRADARACPTAWETGIAVAAAAAAAAPIRFDQTSLVARVAKRAGGKIKPVRLLLCRDNKGFVSPKASGKRRR